MQKSQRQASRTNSASSAISGVKLPEIPSLAHELVSSTLLFLGIDGGVMDCGEVVMKPYVPLPWS